MCDEIILENYTHFRNFKTVFFLWCAQLQNNCMFSIKKFHAIAASIHILYNLLGIYGYFQSIT